MAWSVHDGQYGFARRVAFDVTRLYRIAGNHLTPLARSRLANEASLQGWIADEPSKVGLDVLVIGREVVIENGGRIDILAINREGDLSIIELKRDRTPRDIIAQVLDYASWVATLDSLNVQEIARQKLGKPLAEAFRERFDDTLPEILNSSHSMIIVASEFDASSERIVRYLADEHSVPINTAFFTTFEENGQQFLTADWLMDQEQVIERAERRKRPWTGYYYVNVGHHQGSRSWDDMKRFGFIAAGGLRKYSMQLDRLSPGDPLYAYQKGHGYVGFGVVAGNPVMAKDFRVNGNPLNPEELADQGILRNRDDSDTAEYLVAVDWRNTVALDDAFNFGGMFANQNVVCKLRHADTLDTLAERLGTHTQ